MTIGDDKMSQQNSRLLTNLFLSFMTSLVVIFNSVSGEKILLFPFQIDSQIIALNAIGNELVGQGHVVYSVIHSKMIDRLDQLRFGGIKPLVYKISDETTSVASTEYQQTWINDILKGKLQRFYDSISQKVNQQCDDMELDDGFKGSMVAHKFDLAVVEGLDFALCNYLFVSALEIPYVTLTSYEDSDILRQPSVPSFVPSVFMLNTDQMEFGDRLISFFHYFVPSLTKQFTPSKHHNLSLFETYSDILDPDVHSYTDLPKKALATFISRGYMLESPVAHLPNVHSVECLTASDVTTVPKGFEDLIKAANHGFVLVSFGTLISFLPDDTMQMLFDAFKTRREMFLVKYTPNGTVDFKTPSNVKLFPWLPQNELLGQPGAQLMISHGGNLGQYEALYHGVPMLNMPLFAEQHHNAFRVEHRGYGITLDWKDVDSDKLAAVLKSLLDDISFKERTRQAAYLIRSRPFDGRQVAAYWIDHLLQFGGDHIRSASIDLSWSQYWMLDILLLLFCSVIAFLIGILVLVRWLVAPFLKKVEKPKEKKQ